MEKTVWSLDGKTIPTIEPHTKTKHLLLEQYLTDYIRTLYGTGKYGVTTFTIIDGFCGGGIYSDPELNSNWYGSPVRLISAIKEGFLQSKRTYSLNVKLIFIDSNKEHLECLKNVALLQSGLDIFIDQEMHVVERYKQGELSIQCDFIHDTFENKVNYCCSEAERRKGNSLFFLDPFGWSDVSMQNFKAPIQV